MNPFAGMGGALGLKGTDGQSLAIARAQGAIPVAGPKARRALRVLAARAPKSEVVTIPGALGADWLDGLDLTTTVLNPAISTGTAEDTRDAVRTLLAAGCELIVFAGGDGTARDIAAIAPPELALLGIPSGVKMHSAVFAISPEAAGGIWAEIETNPSQIDWMNNAEIVDIDESSLRLGRLSPRIFSHVRVPIARNRMQASKGGPRQDWSQMMHSAAAEIAAEMEPETLYIIGPGTSAMAVPEALALRSTLLGVDAIRNRRLVARDASRGELEALAGQGEVRIVLGITGRQGFLLGRGNQQISPELIARAGFKGLIVLASEPKLLALAQPALWVDTGDPTLDAELEGFAQIRTGAGRRLMMRVRKAN
ncbi:ATP-NAD kinase family protein [Paracoccus aminophilus]|uniref:ATP-NAD kinase family protein n=1 Tax=Paracoccus aminophilus TaxID=34003 RepID=UPI00130E7909|nr:NAD(+)/NADH kinase [Paracoccus aminophilus]